MPHRLLPDKRGLGSIRRRSRASSPSPVPPSVPTCSRCWPSWGSLPAGGRILRRALSPARGRSLARRAEQV